MEEENYWKQFMASGRIEDYLAYAEETKERDLGEYPYGYLFCNRDGHKPDACR